MEDAYVMRDPFTETKTLLLYLDLIALYANDQFVLARYGFTTYTGHNSQSQQMESNYLHCGLNINSKCLYS